MPCIHTHSREHAYRCVCMPGGAREVPVNLRVLPRAPHAHYPPMAEERAPEPPTALTVTQMPATHTHQWATCPLCPVSQLHTPWSSSALPRPGWSSKCCFPLSHQCSQAAGHQGQPHTRAGTPVQELRQLCPLPAPGVALITARDPAGWQPPGTPHSAFSARSAGAGEQGQWMGPVPSTPRCSLL